MSITSANVRNLNNSRAQALQALQSVSERLVNILGDTDLSVGDGTRRVESGDLVNEDGLPIIDITEPVDELDTPSLSAATEEDEVIEEDNNPELITKLSPEALAISRKHRDKILDLLEQEEEREALQTRQEHQLELKRKRDAARIEMQKRMLNQGVDLEKRRQSKELEKRMAKALISGLGEPEPVKNNTPAQHPDGKPKKVVTFADRPSVGSEAIAKSKEDVINWGDVIPAMSPSQKDLLTSSRMQPMKMEVVERTSSIPLNSVSTRQEFKRADYAEPTGDSDDESDLEVASETTILEVEDEDVVLSAQSHRELAIEYHQRREALASSAGALSLDDDLPDDHGPDVANWDKEEVPLDATLAHSLPKPPISKFKTSLINRHDSQTLAQVSQTNRPPLPSRDPTGISRSATLGTSVLPPDALSKSIKLGKLMDGQLVAGPQDEESIDKEEQEEEEIRKLLLTSMEEYSGIAAQIMVPAANGSYWAKSVAHDEKASSRTLPPAEKAQAMPKASRFKVNRAQSRAISESEVSSPPRDYDSSASTLTHDKLEAASAHARRPATKLTPNRQLPSIPSTSHSIVIDSPSMHPSSHVVEPISSRHPVSPSPSPQKGPTIIPTPSNQLSQRQTPVMVDNVKERSVGHIAPVNSGLEVKPWRVSRFKADRSGYCATTDGEVATNSYEHSSMDLKDPEYRQYRRRIASTTEHRYDVY